jgi:hypothetical protein
MMNGNPKTMKHVLAISALLCFCETAFGDSYEGKIGSFPIWMDLAFKPGEGSATGSYFYKKVGTTIQLRGEIDGNRLTLGEYSDKGDATGFFVCTLRGDSLTGRWGRDPSDSAYPVVLRKTDPALRKSAKKHKSVALTNQDGRKSKFGKLEFDRETLFDGKGYSWLHSCRKSSDGYLIATGDTSKPIFVKLAANGVRTWEISYPFLVKSDELHSITETGDHGYVLLGITSIEGGGGVMIRAGRDGKALWHKVFKERLEGVLETPKGYLLAGSVDDAACLIQTDLHGDVVHKFTYRKLKDLNSLDAIIKIPSGYLAVGYCRGDDRNPGWVCRLNESFVITEERFYETDLYLKDLLPISGNEILITGMIYNGRYQAYLASIDATLKIKWNASIPGGDNELNPSIAKDGNVTLLTGNGDTKRTWISKIDVVLPPGK